MNSDDQYFVQTLNYGIEAAIDEAVSLLNPYEYFSCVSEMEPFIHQKFKTKVPTSCKSQELRFFLQTLQQQTKDQLQKKIHEMVDQSKLKNQLSQLQMTHVTRSCLQECKIGQDEREQFAQLESIEEILQDGVLEALYHIGNK